MLSKCIRFHTDEQMDIWKVHVPNAPHFVCLHYFIFCTLVSLLTFSYFNLGCFSFEGTWRITVFSAPHGCCHVTLLWHHCCLCCAIWCHHFGTISLFSCLLIPIHASGLWLLFCCSLLLIHLADLWRAGRREKSSIS